TPGIELAWWDEQGHLVIVAGHNAVDSAIKVAEGGANITAGPLWKQYATGNAGFEVNSVAWLDVAKIRQTFGEMPLPGFQQESSQPPVTVNRLAAVLGLDSLQTVVARSGYKGRAL